MNIRRTKKVIQAEYEQLYTGPEFILQTRYGQLLSIVFVAMTYSSGLPVIYLIVFAWMFLTYWIDKILLLRYYRITEGFTKHLAQYVAATLPFSVIIHCLFGLMFFSFPEILITPTDPDYFGNNTQYFNPKRLG